MTNIKINMPLNDNNLSNKQMKKGEVDKRI